MDRTGKIAVLITVVLMLGWLKYQASLVPPPPPPGSPSPSPAATGATSPQPSASPSTVKSTEPPPPPEPVLPEETKEIDTPQVVFTFTNHGGGIASAMLKNHIVDDISKKNIVLNDYNVVPIGAISQKPGVDADASYTTTTDKTGITFQRHTQDKLEITKKFTLPSGGDPMDQFIATLDISFVNRGDQPYKSDGYYIHLGSAAPIHQHDMSRYICLDWYVNGKARETNVTWFGASNFPIFGHPERLEFAEPADNSNAVEKIGWSGVYNQYFTTIVTPVGESGNRIWANRIPIDVPSHKSGIEWLNSHPPGSVSEWYAINGAMGMPGFEIKPGDTHTQQFKIYVGPRQYELIKHMDGGQVAIVQMGYSGPISKVLLKLLNWLKKVVGGYAVAIIVLTVGIKLLLWPLQNRSTQSMKKMQLVAPKLNEIREKYKDDPAKYNQEMMKLYKAYGVNPLAGCLPMVIQLPVFVGFYSMLGSAIELRNSQFFWVHDLSQPDTVGHILGYSINILPLCMAATSAWMMAITPKSGDKAQQRMTLLMPLIFLWICYNYASGLALYMMVSNLFSVVQFIVTKNQPAPKLEKVAVPSRKRK